MDSLSRAANFSLAHKNRYFLLSEFRPRAIIFIKRTSKLRNRNAPLLQTKMHNTLIRI